MNRNGKNRQNINVSPCKCSLHSSVCRLEQPACCGWRQRGVLCGDGAEPRPEPIIPLCLLRLQTAQIPHEAQTAADALSVFLIPRSGRRRALVQQPFLPLLTSLWSMWSHLLRAGLLAECISESYWVIVRPHTAQISMTNM